MVEIAPDGRLLSDGTLLVDPDVAKHIPRPSPAASQEILRASRDTMKPITPGEQKMFGYTRRVRFDLPVASFEQLRDVSEVLSSLAMALQGLSYMRHKKEAYVIGEARRTIERYKEKLKGI